MRSASGEKGMALPAAIWLAALVAVVGAGTLMIAGADLRLSASLAERTQARGWAEGVAALAALRLAEAEPLYRAALESGQALELTHKEGSARIRLSREEDRLDLNAADPAEIAAFLEKEGAPARQAERMAAAIGDFRDADDLVRLSGAEAAAYAQAGLEHGPLNRPFRSLDELRLVLGLDASARKALARGATVWGRRPGAAMVDDLPRLRRTGEERGVGFWAAALSGRAAQTEGQGGDALRIEIEANVAGAEESVIWIVSIDRSRTPPYRVLDRR